MLLSSCVLATVVAALSTAVLGAATPIEERQTPGRTVPILTNFPGQGALPSLADIIQLNATNGTFLPIQNIQGDIFVGMKKPKELFYFFSINDPTAFKAALKNNVIGLVTSTATLLSAPAQQPSAFLNIAFSKSGLTKLGITDNLGDPQFSSGMFADASSIGDVQSRYESAFKGTGVHGVLLIGSDQTQFIDSTLSSVTGFFGSSITEQYRLSGAARPGFQAGHEHFGYLDGISQPAISGFAINALPGQAIIPSGMILTGRFGDLNMLQRPSWALDGSFLVFRKLRQLVPEFQKYLTDNAVQNAQGTLTAQQGAELLGARMIGRWRSGAPVDLRPTADDPALGADPTRNNAFDYSHLNSFITTDQSRCPFSAHIRKTRPRADLGDLNIQNFGIRAGIPYGPEVIASENSTHTSSTDRGLAFVEYQSIIANGFRFQQLQWSNTANFPPGKNETVGIEPIIGQVGNGAAKTASGLDPRDASRVMTIPEFVKSDGGEYFFTPSISALRNKIAA